MQTLKKIAIWLGVIYACLLIFDEAYIRIYGQTPQQSLTLVLYSNITGAATLDGCDLTTPTPCIDNRSQFIRQSSVSSFRAIGTGTWSVTMQYADVTPGPWTSFGSTAVVTQAGPASGIGYGIGPSSTSKPYHDYIRFVITGNATILNYNGTRQFWWLPSVAAIAFPITANQGGTSGLFVADALFSTLPLACAAAASANEVVYVSQNWTGLTTQTLSCNLTFLGGTVKPASGQTVTMSIVSAPLSTICDISGGGACLITSAIGQYFPEWWGATLASADAGTAAASNNGKNITFSQKGTYLFASSWTALHGKSNIVIAGMQAQQTILSWPSYTTTNGCLIDLNAPNESNITFTGLTVYGAGKSAGTNITGVCSTAGNVGNNNIRFHNFEVGFVSGNGISITDWFSQKYDDVWHTSVGGEGTLDNGDSQGSTFSGSGHFSNDVGSYVWDVRDGNPLMYGLNAGDSGAGATLGGCAHFGAPMAVTNSYPTILSMNCEGVNVSGGNGLYFESGSGPAYLGEVNTLCDTATCGFSIKADNVGQTGILVGPWSAPTFNGGTWATPPGSNPGAINVIDFTSNAVWLNLNIAVNLLNPAAQNLSTGPNNGTWFGPAFQDSANGRVAGLPACGVGTSGFVAANVRPQEVVDANSVTLGAVTNGGGSSVVMTTCNVYTGHWVNMINLTN